MKLSNSGAGMKSCEGENDKTGNLKHCNSAETNRSIHVPLVLRVLILVERCTGFGAVVERAS